jgi:DNA-binding transcriptional ArsR family regulator
MPADSVLGERQKALDGNGKQSLTKVMAYGAASTALSDPTRRLVFERILAAPRPVAAIAEGLPVSRSAVSQHLKVLKDAGLITERRNGTCRLYTANPQALGELRGAIEAMWHEAFGSMAAAIDEDRER